ncbi:MAG: ATP-binding cassette domain-containing protein, partial [Lutibacter sp.]
MESILKVQNLSISFGTKNELNTVVNAISFELDQQQILGIVGESGSGKSVTALAILGLLPKNATVTGNILFNN